MAGLNTDFLERLDPNTRYTASDIGDVLMALGLINRDERRALVRELGNLRRKISATHERKDGRFTPQEWKESSDQCDAEAKRDHKTEADTNVITDTPAAELVATELKPSKFKTNYFLLISIIATVVTSAFVGYPLINLSKQLRTDGLAATEERLIDQIGITKAELEELDFPDNLDPRALYEIQQYYNQKGHYIKALRVGNILLAEHKKESVFLAYVYFQLGISHGNTSAAKQSLDFLNKSLNILASLNNTDPLIPQCRIEIARARIRLGLNSPLLVDKDLELELNASLKAYFSEIKAIERFLEKDYEAYLDLQTEAMNTYVRLGDLTGQISCTLGLAIGHFANNNKDEGFKHLAHADVLMSTAGGFDSWLNLYTLARWIETDRTNHVLMIRLKNLPSHDDAGILFRSLLHEN